MLYQVPGPGSGITKLFEEHGGGFGQGLRWEWQPLGFKEGAR